jgi:hypothetical protein
MALEISIEQPTKLFKKHLEEEGNERLIFSGAFGIGKTYFLDKFFAPDNEEYVAVKLAPVNYSLSSNEDIFKLIKYDILFELITKHALTLERESINIDIALGVMIPAKADAIIKGLLGIIPLLNKSTETIQKALDSIKDLSGIIEDIKSQREAASKESDIIAFGNEIIKMFQLETDYITEFLEDSLNKIVKGRENSLRKNLEKGGHASKILIIDDLDRIDPEHIFRLFNIFSAHLDYNKTDKNKFGFDKVIFVCDIHNIRTIFHSRYGTDTDFTGYIDKFFSQEIFFFSNEQAIREAAEEFIKNIQTPSEQERFFTDGVIRPRHYRDQTVLSTILTEMLFSGAIKMRRLQNSFQMHYQFSERKLTVFENYHTKSISSWQLPGLILTEILSRICGGAEYLVKALRLTSRYRRSSEYESKGGEHSVHILRHVIPLLEYKKHKFQTPSFTNESQASHTLRSIEGGSIEYKIMKSSQENDRYYASLNSDNMNTDSFEYFARAVEVLITDGIIK